MAGLSSANGISAQLIQTVPESVLDQIPGAAPPDGQTSNLINPPDKGPQIVAGASVIVGVAYLMVFLRIYAKTCLIRKASWDDRMSLFKVPPPSPIACVLFANLYFSHLSFRRRESFVLPM